MAGPVAARTTLTIDVDKTFSFAGLHTWTWHPDGAGDVRLAVSADDDPKRVAARVDPVIIPAVERALGARGFTRTGDFQDLYVHSYVLASVKQFTQEHGQFLAPVPEWGVPAFSPSTSALRVYSVGTLLIDVTAPKRPGIVWRGAAQREIDFERPDMERRQVLEKAIADLFKKFPPRK